MIKIVYGKLFIKSAKKLPKKLQNKLADLIIIFSDKPYNSLLHTKPLTGKLLGFYSFRINREWRVVFQFNNSSEIQLIKVGHRKDIYRKL